MFFIFFDKIRDLVEISQQLTQSDKISTLFGLLFDLLRFILMPATVNLFLKIYFKNLFQKFILKNLFLKKACWTCLFPKNSLRIFLMPTRSLRRSFQCFKIL